MQTDPNAVATQWANQLAAATTKITAGVGNVTVAPGQAAARQKAVWAANVAAAQDKWASKVASVTLTDWQTAMTTKGIPRIASGATAAEPKFAAFMTKLLPYIAAQRNALPARGNLEQNITRMSTFVRGMAKFTNS